MSTIALLTTLISSLVSGLLGVFISFHLFNRMEKRKIKSETARKLFGSKHDIKSANFKEAMNEIMIVFSDVEDVISAMEEFWQTLQVPLHSRRSGAADDKLIKLMKRICREIGIKYKKLPDEYYLRYFSA